MAIEIVGSLITGTPPVAPPKDVKKFALENDVSAGNAVKLNTDGKIENCAQNLTDAFAIALETGTDVAPDEIRVQYLMPGCILRGEVDQAVTVGTDVGLDSGRDKFLNAGTGAIVLRYEADVGGVSHMVWAVPYRGLFFRMHV